MAVSAGERSAAQGAASSPDARSSAVLGEIPGPDPTARRVQRRRAIRRTLIASDLVAFTLAALVAQQVSNLKIQAVPSLVIFGILLPLWMIGMGGYGLYNGDEQRPDHTTLDDAGPAFTFITIGTWLGLVVLSFVGSSAITIEDATVFWVSALVLVLGGRAISRGYLRWHRTYLQNTIIVGAGDVGQLVGRKMLQHPELGIRLVGFVDSEPKQMRSDLSTIPLLGAPDEIVGTRPAPRRGARGRRILQRSTRPARRSRPQADRPRRPDRPGPTAVRGGRPFRRDARRRGAATREPPSDARLARRPRDQAWDRPGRRDTAPDPLCAALRDRRVAHQERLAGARLLRPGAARARAWTRSRSTSSGRCASAPTPSRTASTCSAIMTSGAVPWRRTATSTSSSAPTPSPASGRGSGGRASTSCPS